MVCATIAAISLVHVAGAAAYPFDRGLLLFSRFRQYESSASFVVRRAEGSSKNMIGLGQIFGIGLGASQAQSEATLVYEYLLSHDAVARLRKELWKTSSSTLFPFVALGFLA